MTLEIEYVTKEKEENKPLYFDDLEDGDVFRYLEEGTSLGKNSHTYIKDETHSKAFSMELTYSCYPDLTTPVKKLKAKIIVTEE